MTYDPEKHHRRSVRLEGYDYAQSGAYFVTIVTQDRACLFGEVVNGVIKLNDAGRMVQAVWDELRMHYSGVETDAFVLMLNHMHGIVVLVGAGPRACPDAEVGVATGPRACPHAGQGNQEIGQPQGVAPTLSLPDVVHRFKTLTTKRFADGVKHSGWIPFRGRLWQRNYYEHVIRDEETLSRLRQYIRDNPARWEFDHENPAAKRSECEDAWRN